MSRKLLPLSIAMSLLLVCCLDEDSELGKSDGGRIEATYAMEMSSRSSDDMSISDAGPILEDMVRVIDDGGLDDSELDADGLVDDEDAMFDEPDADGLVDEAGNEPVMEDMEVDDNPCSDPSPRSRCFIDGECIIAGQPQANNPCFVCLPNVNLFTWTQDQDSPICASQDYWADIDQEVGRSPHGHSVGLVCHNCYTQPGRDSQNEESEAGTRSAIRAAQLSGADLIELDIKEEGGVIYVDHEDDPGTGGSRFDVILSYNELRQGTQPLYIEIKERNTSEAFIENLLRDLMRFGYGVEGRPVFLRAFYGRRESLLIARRLLAQEDFSALRPYLRLNTLFPQNNPNSIAAAHARIRELYNMGMHGVEFRYDDDNLLSKIAYARSLGLGVTLFTIPARMGEVFIANSRDLVDALVLDYPLDAGRDVVEDDNALVNLDMSQQMGLNEQITYQRSNAQSRTLNLGGANQPTVEYLGPGEDRFGGSLIFDSSQEQSLTLYDADTRNGEGYFVSVLVNFDDLSIADGETQSIVAKSDAGGFALELDNPEGLGAAVLRFGVRVGEDYVYATYPKSLLNGTDAYWITGCYDGDGAVRMWVNNSDDDVDASRNVSGGVVNNNSPIVIGADPQGAVNRRFHTSAKIQRINVQSWGDR